MRLRARMVLGCSRSICRAGSVCQEGSEPEEVSRKVPLQPAREDDFRLCFQQVSRRGDPTRRESLGNDRAKEITAADSSEEL